MTVSKIVVRRIGSKEPSLVEMTPDEEAAYLASQEAAAREEDARRAAAPLPRLVVADRLTDGEVAVVAALQSGNAQQQRWWLRWVSADTVNPTNLQVVGGFEAVFGEARAAELLAPEA